MHNTREIPREKWSDYLSRVARTERDHIVRIEAAGRDLGDQPIAKDLPLRDIELEQKGSDKGAIEVSVKLGQPGEEFTHRILKPDHIYVEEKDSGELECLNIEDKDHLKTLIYFKEPSAGRTEARV